MPQVNKKPVLVDMLEQNATIIQLEPGKNTSDVDIRRKGYRTGCCVVQSELQVALYVRVEEAPAPAGRDVEHDGLAKIKRAVVV
jgi:hypothetical protein